MGLASLKERNSSIMRGRLLNMKTAVLFFTLMIPAFSFADSKGVNVTMPMVEKALRFLRNKALDPPPEATLLRAGVVRVCGEDLSAPGCKLPGLLPPNKGGSGPDANRAWRTILESALAAASLSQKNFDKTVFERYVMDAMVEAMGDPSGFYVLPSVYKKISSIPEDFVGFGLRVYPSGDALKIIAVHEGSPAYDAGLLHGDRIIRINGEGVSGVRRPIALAALWGADGHKIQITVTRMGGTVRNIKLSYTPWSFTPFFLERHGDLISIHVRYFKKGLTETIARELAGSCGGMVLDLRNATAGDEDEMIALADLLLKKGSIGSREMRGDLGSRKWNAKPGSPGEHLDVPVAVVINGGTSGLAEIFASAVRKAGRGILIGRRSAGIDTQETIHPLKDGSAIQITSTRLRGPDNTSLEDGVLPHLETRRAKVVQLGIRVLDLTRGSGMNDLLEAARQAIALP